MALAAASHSPNLRRAGAAPRRSLSCPSLASAVRGESPSPAHEDLASYVAGGPVAAALGIRSAQDVDVSEWRRLGDKLCRLLRFNPASLSEVQRQRVYRYYLPVYVWVLRQLEAHTAAGKRGTLVVGVSAPQGCGKSTLVSSLQALLGVEGHDVAGVSLDDFYLTGEQQDAVAAAHPGNELLRFRGNPGTHDTSLARETLSSLVALGSETSGEEKGKGREVRVPSYDKSLRAGRGDRAPPEAWPTAEAPLQVLLFEGWSLGFAPLSDEARSAVPPSLLPVDDALRSYADNMESFVDAWLVLRVADPSWVFGWRAQAERALRDSGRPGLSDAQVKDFVDRFMPSYAAYLPRLYAEGPAGRAGVPRLALDIDQDRTLIAAE